MPKSRKKTRLSQHISTISSTISSNSFKQSNLSKNISNSSLSVFSVHYTLEKYHLFIKAASLMLFCALAFTFIFSKSLFTDEHSDLASGYSKLVTRDFRFVHNHAQGNVVYGIPLLFMDLNFPEDNSCWTYMYSQYGRPEWKYPLSDLECEYQFLFVYNPGKLRLMLVLARLVALAFGVGLMLLLSKWIEEEFGKASSSLFCILYATSPVMLVESSSANIDIVYTLLLFATLYIWFKFIKSIKLDSDSESGESGNKNTNISYGIKYALFAGIFYGLAIAAKLSAIPYLPAIVFFPFVFAAAKKYLNHGSNLKGNSGSYGLKYFKPYCKAYYKGVAVLLLFAWLSLSSAYLFQGSFRPLADGFAKDQNIADKQKWLNVISSDQFLSLAFNKIPSPLPYPFVKSATFIISDLKYGVKMPSFLFGKFYPNLIPWYFPAIFLVKSTLPALILFAIGLWLILARKAIQLETDILLVMIFVLGFLSQISNKFQVSFRYILPVFIVSLFIASRATSGISVVSFKRAKRAKPEYNFIRNFMPVFMSICIPICIMTLILLSLLIPFFMAPHFDAYFNILAGGPFNGVDVAAYSNFYGGGNMYMIQEFVKSNNISDYGFAETDVVYPEYYLPDAKPIPCSATSGIWIIGANAVRMHQDCYGWLNYFNPKEKIGWTVFVYDISDEDIKEVTRQT